MRFRVTLLLLVAMLATGLSGCSSSETRERKDAVADTQSATLVIPLPAETQTFSVQLPAGASMQQFALGAEHELRLGRKASVVTSAGGFAAAVNAGSGRTELGREAKSGDITSQAPVRLERQARVTGNVTSAGTVQLEPDAEVTGTVAANSALTFETFSWTVDFPASTLAISVPTLQEASADPGAYTSVTLAPHARLNLSAGTYYFDSLDLKSGATLALNPGAGTISIYIRNQFEMRGELQVSGSADQVLLVYAGTKPVTFKTALLGTLVAPNAAVRLEALRSTGPGAPSHQGAVFSESVELGERASLTLLPFSGWTRTTLTVRTFLLDETAPDQRGDPAGAGVYVRINGEDVGVTGDDGTLTVDVTEGTLNVQAIVPSFSLGEGSISVAAGMAGVLDIVLDDGKEVVEPTTLVLPEAVANVLPNTFTSATLRFEREGVPVVLDVIEQVELLNRDGDVVASLASLFELSGGSLAATDPAALLSALAPQAARQLAIRVTALDGLGFTHSAVVRFFLGQFRIVGTLTAPPSNPTLNVANLPVEVKLLGTNVTFARVSDASGRFEIASMPLGNVGFDSQTLEGGNNYYGQGTLFLAQSLAVSLVMRSVSDVVGGVPPLTSSPLAPLARSSRLTEPATTQETLARRASQERALRAAPSAKPAALAQAADVSASVTATAAQQNVAVSATAELTVPKGTQTVTLKYNVFTVEYPFYVLSQSIFNDVWSLAVYGGQGGQQLFEMTRNVNSQVAVPPIWQGNGSTGDITQIIDVAALTATEDATLTLFASSMNVGDSALTTIVNATLSAEVKLTINEVTPDTVTPSNSDSSYYSIPRSGDGNVYERWFTLALTKPTEATISQVRVILRGTGDLMTLFEEAPGPNVQIVDDEHLRVRVSMHSFTSSVNSDPPPIHDITYRFRVQAGFEGETLEDERDSGVRHALWRMPPTIPRYGVRDNGLDDWAARGCYTWITTNATLLTRVDDISGEHARYIGHATHQRGVDIDQFHYYTFPGGVSGGANYTALRNNVINALNGDTVALGRVSAWVTATRTGLANLLALNEVNQLIYAIGSPTQQQITPTRLIQLANGWARDLLGDGSITATSGETLDTGLGAWSEDNNARVQYNAQHNSHVHIALNSALLAN